MKKILKLIIGVLILFQSQLTTSQEKFVTGKVISEEMIEIPGALIMTMNEKVIDTTDFYGNFRFENIDEIKKIKIVSLMSQTEEITLTENCSNLEVILLNEWIYDFITLKRAERKKKRERKKIIPKLYDKAYEKGIFTNEKNCWQHLI